MRAFADRYFATLDAQRGADRVPARARAARLPPRAADEQRPRVGAAWRAEVPIDELFETVVDSAFVGMRKPDPAIYALTLERLGLPAEACVFIDDLEHQHRRGARVGMHAVHFRDTEQAIAEIAGGPRDRVTDVLLHGDTVRYAGAAPRGAAGDHRPVHLPRAGGRRCVLTNALERDADRRVRPDAELLGIESWGLLDLVADGHARATTRSSRSSRASSRAPGLRRRAVVPPELPVAVADRLRADGVELVRRPRRLRRRRRRAKTAAELAGIRARPDAPPRRAWRPRRRCCARPSARRRAAARSTASR